MYLIQWFECEANKVCRLACRGQLRSKLHAKAVEPGLFCIATLFPMPLLRGASVSMLHVRIEHSKVPAPICVELRFIGSQTIARRAGAEQGL